MTFFLSKTPCLFLLIGCVNRQPPVSELAPSQDRQFEMTDALPFDPGITRGTLDNGLRYFIEPNAYPKDRVELRLVVSVGSLQEDPDQLGLAHFLEHMAFNGTTHFEAGELVEFLESTGVQFGAHLNAMTTFDSTTFMLTLPTDEEGLLDQGLLILQDWAHGMLLESEEIEKERGVVLEEWRRAQGVGFRLSHQTLPFVLGEDYAARWPIGTEKSLQTFEEEALTRFYRDWYRPDLMGIVIVGDVDVESMEGRVQELFGGLQGPDEPRPLMKAELPTPERGAVLIVTDPELQTPSIQLNRTLPFVWGEDVEFLRGYIAGRLANQMLNERIGFLVRGDDPPILGAGGQTQVFNSHIQMEVFGVGVTEDKIETGLEAILTELRRASLHGFTEPEWQRALAQTRSMWETVRAEARNTDSSTHASEIERHILTGEFMPGTELEYLLVKHMMDNVLTIQDANRAIQGFMQPENRLVLLSLPEKEGLVAPSEEVLRRLVARVDASNPTPPEAETQAPPLVSSAPEPGRIVEESHVEALGLTIWKLSNGVEVHLMPTDLKEDEIVFSSYSWGGLSLLSDEDYVAGSSATSVSLSSGLGDHDVDSLVKILAGVTAGVSTEVSNLTEGLAGNTSPRDLEILFQMIHLRVTDPRFDADAYDRLQTSMVMGLQNRLMSPYALYSDLRTRMLLGDHPRTRPWTIETLEQMDLTRSEEIYRDRFADMSDQVFFFVGAFELDEMRPLVQTWLATLPVVEREETWRDEGIRYTEGGQSEVLYAGTEPKSQVSIDYLGHFSYSRDTTYLMRVASTALEQILRTRLREDLGGTYSVSVQSSTGRIPVEDYAFTISFGCDPKRVEELRAVVYEEIDRMKIVPVSDEVISSIREMDIRDLETNRQRNGYWLHMLETYHQRGEDPLNHLKIEERYQSVSAEKIRQIFTDYFDSNRRIEVVMMPEDYAP